MRILNWTEFAGQDPFHIVRVQLPSPVHVPTHTHSNYAELFLIESGGLTHRVNNRRSHLDAGTLVLIRPGDIHHLKMETPGTVYSNVAIPLPVIDELQQRYLKTDPFFWDRNAPQPTEFFLEAEPLARIIQLIDQLSRAPRTRLEIDWFLLNLFHELGRFRIYSGETTLPDWLARACREIKKPEAFRTGLSAFNQLAGRSPEHVSRVLKKCTGQTPTQLINKARLEEAARQLCMTSKEIIDISADCGFDNLGYFYRLFKKRYALSPRRYRLANHSVVASL